MQAKAHAMKAGIALSPRYSVEQGLSEEVPCLKFLTWASVNHKIKFSIPNIVST